MDTKKYTILYVDDELNSLSSFKNLFRKKFNIIPANSGKEGLTILESQRIDLIITDQRMPEMTGLEFLKKVKKKWPNIKYILLTAFAEIDVIKEAINEVGIYWYMNKPFDPSQMEQMITKAIEADWNDLLLKESEEKFRSVFNSMVDVFVRSNLNGICSIISPSIYKMLGYKADEVLGRNLIDFYLDPNQRGEIINELRNTNEVKNFEIDLVKKDGTTITVSSNTRMYYDSKGEPAGLEGNFRDITAVKKTEKELRKSELSFRTVFESSPIAKIIVNSDGLIIQSNLETEKVFGYSANEMIGKPIGMLMPKQFRSVHKGHLKQFYKRPESRKMGKGLDLFAQHKDGSEFPVEIALKPIELDGKKVVLTVINDISERIQAEEKLKVSNLREKELADIVRDAPIAIAYGYPDGRLDNCNAAFCKLTGYTISELQHINWNEVLTPSKWVTAEAEQLGQLCPSSNSVKYEKEYIHKNGDSIPIELLVTGEFDSEGHILYYIAFITDISERVQAEEKLKVSILREKELADMVRDAPMAIGYGYPDGKLANCNAAFCKLTGYTISELQHIDWNEALTPDKWKSIEGELLSQLSPSSNSVTYEKEFIHKNGHIIPIELLASAEFDSEGHIIRYTGFARDITERKQAQIELQESEEKFSNAFNDSPIGQTILNIKTWERIAVNYKFREIFGFTNEEVLDVDIKKNPLAVNLETLKKGMALAIKHGELKDYPIDMYHSSGEIRNIVASATKTSQRDNEFFIVSYIDITDRKKAEEKLQESEEKFRILVTKTEEIIYMIAIDGTFLLSEGKGLSKLGLKPGEVVGKSVFNLYQDYPEMLDDMKKTFNGESIVSDTKIGDNYFRNWFTPQTNINGKITGLLGLAINITEQKKAELEVESYQNRLKDLAQEVIFAEEKVRKQIAADLHDDVGQMLSSMRMQLSPIINMEENPDLITRMNSISQALLIAIQATRSAIFDLSPPQLNEIGLYAAIHDWAKEEMERKNKISTTITGEYEAFNLEENTGILLFRSVKELCVNVLKHARANSLKIDFKKEGDSLKITVEDDGVGFNFNPKRIFLKSDTYGLFSINVRLADLGGTMSVNSIIDKGTKIILTIPFKSRVYEN